VFFFYSRKPQLLLLLGWTLGLAFMFVYVTGDESSPFRPKTDVTQRAGARLGEMPTLEERPAPVPAAQIPATPAGDPELNLCTALRVMPRAEGKEKKLVLELDYIPALTNGFTPDKARNYYIEEPPTFVVALGEPWKTELKPTMIPVDMPETNGVSLIVSRSRHLRVLVHTRTEQQAVRAKVKVSPTENGLRAEVYFAR
jgi:hypothetical protein